SGTSSSARRSWPRLPPHLWGPRASAGVSGGDVSSGLPPHWWGGQVGMSALAFLPTGGEVRSGASLPTCGEVRWGCQHWPSSPLVGRSGGDVSPDHLRGYPCPRLIDFQDGHARAAWLRFIAR